MGSPVTAGIERTRAEYVVLNMDRGSTVANRVHVAGTSAARRRGFLGVSGLPEGAGLWISPCEAIHTFGMRIPLDVLFLDREFRVRKLSSCLAPWRICICLSAESVLELAHGAISGSNTQAGDRLRFQR